MKRKFIMTLMGLSLITSGCTTMTVETKSGDKIHVGGLAAKQEMEELTLGDLVVKNYKADSERGGVNAMWAAVAGYFGYTAGKVATGAQAASTSKHAATELTKQKGAQEATTQALSKDKTALGLAELELAE